jgi:hypothetical protein
VPEPGGLHRVRLDRVRLDRVRLDEGPAADSSVELPWQERCSEAATSERRERTHHRAVSTGSMKRRVSNRSSHQRSSSLSRQRYSRSNTAARDTAQVGEKQCRMEQHSNVSPTVTWPQRNSVPEDHGEHEWVPLRSIQLPSVPADARYPRSRRRSGQGPSAR